MLENLQSNSNAHVKAFGIQLTSIIFCTLFFFNICIAQSSEQNLPTPISTNEVIGEIKARDIGDSRLTTYYFVFNGDRGDIFVNVVTSNLNGDIDIFLAEGLQPKTKITLFADDSENETGRVIYLRKPEKLIMRIQGRTPNDDPATFQIKFAGSFQPIQALAKNTNADFPEVTTASNDAVVKVNSVGTIIEEKPTPKSEITKAIPVPDESVVEPSVKKTNNEDISAKIEVNASTEDIEINPVKVIAENKTETKKPDIPATFDPTKDVDQILTENRPKSPVLVISDPLAKNNSADANESSETVETNLTVNLKDKQENQATIVRIEKADDADSDTTTEKSTSPLANVYLKVELKNGEKFERSMIEVLSMNVIKGVLTIVTNDGKILEYSILDVVKMTIE